MIHLGSDVRSWVHYCAVLALCPWGAAIAGRWPHQRQVAECCVAPAACQLGLRGVAWLGGRRCEVWQWLELDY